MGGDGFFFEVLIGRRLFLVGGFFCVGRGWEGMGLFSVIIRVIAVVRVFRTDRYIG